MRLSFRAFGGALGASLLLAHAAAHAAPQVTRLTTPAGVTTTSAAPGDVLVIEGAGFGSATGEVWLDRGGYGREAEVLEWNGAGGLIRARLPSLADLGALRLIVRAGAEGSPPYPLLLVRAAASPPAPAAPAPAPASPAPALPPPPGTPADPAIRAVNVLGGAVTTSGIAGTRVLVSGSRLGNSGVLSFNGAAAAATLVWTPSYIVATLPDAPGTGPITVRRDPGLPDEASGVGPSFTILPAPVITGYTHGGAAAVLAHPGDEIGIRGANLGTGGQVTFQGITAKVRSWSPQGITIIVPSIEGTGPVLIVLNPHTGAEVRTQGPAITVMAGG